MKKLLTFSTLGCLATIGAVFAAYIAGPTAVDADYAATNIDVDIGGDYPVLKTFTKLDSIMLPSDPWDEKSEDEEVTPSDINFKFGTEVKSGDEDYTTLALSCVKWDVPTEVEEGESYYKDARFVAYHYEIDEQYYDLMKEDVQATGTAICAYLKFSTHLDESKTYFNQDELQGVDGCSNLTMTNSEDFEFLYGDVGFSQAAALDYAIFPDDDSLDCLTGDIVFFGSNFTQSLTFDGALEKSAVGAEGPLATYLNSKDSEDDAHYNKDFGVTLRVEGKVPAQEHNLELTYQDDGFKYSFDGDKGIKLNEGDRLSISATNNTDQPISLNNFYIENEAKTKKVQLEDMGMYAVYYVGDKGEEQAANWYYTYTNELVADQRFEEGSNVISLPVGKEVHFIIDYNYKKSLTLDGEAYLGYEASTTHEYDLVFSKESDCWGIDLSSSPVTFKLFDKYEFKFSSNVEDVIKTFTPAFAYMYNGDEQILLGNNDLYDFKVWYKDYSSEEAQEGIYDTANWSGFIDYGNSGIVRGSIDAPESLTLTPFKDTTNVELKFTIRYCNIFAESLNSFDTFALLNK